MATEKQLNPAIEGLLPGREKSLKKVLLESKPDLSPQQLTDILARNRQLAYEFLADGLPLKIAVLAAGAVVLSETLQPHLVTQNCEGIRLTIDHPQYSTVISNVEREVRVRFRSRIMAIIAEEVGLERRLVFDDYVAISDKAASYKTFAKEAFLRFQKELAK